MLELIAMMETGSRPETTCMDTLTLPYELRCKSRQRVRLDSGSDAALVLPPGTRLDDGDIVCTAGGQSVAVRAAVEPLSIARTEDALLHARACYHLGNRHVALEIGHGWLSYQPDHVLDDMVRGLGLDVVRESAAFRPERGAYHGHAHGHAHAHAHPHRGTDADLTPHATDDLDATAKPARGAVAREELLER